jgi:hypothetical protein
MPEKNTLIWSPQSDVRETTQMGQFMAGIVDKHDVSLNDLILTINK